VRAAEVSVGATTVSLRASVGLAEMRPGDTAEAWLARADRALYEAKATGRDRLMIAP
jgi:diguanylate cyclase (GGDEF)-like protein